MGASLDKLLEISSPSISLDISGEMLPDRSCLPHEHQELLSILARKNGFYAFESALHFLSLDTNERSWGLSDWNSDELWKSDYNGLASDIFCFATDIFDNQFSIHKNEIHIFDAETGELRWIASSLEAWAAEVLTNYNELTGWNFARDWQCAHGAMKDRERLYPIKPFVLGGDYDIGNFRSLDSAQIMRNSGNIARQIANMPDGGTVELTIISHPS